MYIHTYIHTYIRTYIHVCIYIYILERERDREREVYLYVCIYIYKYMIIQTIITIRLRAQAPYAARPRLRSRVGCFHGTTLKNASSGDPYSGTSYRDPPEAWSPRTRDRICWSAKVAHLSLPPQKRGGCERAQRTRARTTQAVGVCRVGC